MEATRLYLLHFFSKLKANYSSKERVPASEENKGWEKREKERKEGGKKRGSGEKGKRASESRGVWSQWEGAHGGLCEPSEGSKSVAASLSGKEVCEGKAGDGLLTDVVVEGADEEEVGKGGAAERGL